MANGGDPWPTPAAEGTGELSSIPLPEHGPQNHHSEGRQMGQNGFRLVSCVPVEPCLQGGSPSLPSHGLCVGCCSLAPLPACLCPRCLPTSQAGDSSNVSRRNVGPGTYRGAAHVSARQACGQEEVAVTLPGQAAFSGGAVSPASAGPCRALPAAPAAWPGPWSSLFGVPSPLCRRCALGAVGFPDRLKTSHLKHNRLFLWMLLLFCSALQKQLNRGGQL